MSRTAAPAGEVIRRCAGDRRARPFVGLVEQALPQQLLLQLLKGYVQVPRSLRGQADAVQLILPVPVGTR